MQRSWIQGEVKSWANNLIYQIYDGVLVFFMAALTNYYRLGGLKQQKCILSQFWKPEI